jgi:hypothetical protein
MHDIIHIIPGKNADHCGSRKKVNQKEFTDKSPSASIADVFANEFV